MNFELIDNCFQVSVLLCAALAAIVAALRKKERRFLILAMFYICVSMGTLYWVLHIFIFGDVPKVFYVSEISWLAAYLFLLSFQMLRAERIRPLFYLPSLCGALITAVLVMIFRILGPSYFVSAAFAAAVSVIVYSAVRRLGCKCGGRLIDGWLLLCVALQILLYAVSAFMEDFTHFNLYFAVDITLTLSFAALLPLALREEAGK